MIWMDCQINIYFVSLLSIERAERLYLPPIQYGYYYPQSYFDYECNCQNCRTGSGSVIQLGRS